MTTEELIAILSKYPNDTIVKMSGFYAHERYHINTVLEIKIMEDKTSTIGLLLT